MKKLIALILVLTVTGASALVYCQQGNQKASGKSKNEQKEMTKGGKNQQMTNKENKKAGKADREIKEADKDKGQKPDATGNAYGKNKGGKSGKEFGKSRSAEAKSKPKDNKKEQ